MKELLEWLEEGGQDYARGLALYEAHGRSSVVLTTLRYGATDFTRRKLREELTRLAQGTPVAPPPPPVRPQPPAAAAPAPDLRAQRSSWFAERHRLHAQLELVTTDEERRLLAERIVQLSAFLTESYHPAAAEVPRTPPELASLTDVGEIRRRLGNLRSQASKLKRNPARALDLQQVRADIDLLENKLPKP